MPEGRWVAKDRRDEACHATHLRESNVNRITTDAHGRWLHHDTTRCVLGAHREASQNLLLLTLGREQDRRIGGFEQRTRLAPHQRAPGRAGAQKDGATFVDEPSRQLGAVV